MRHRRRGGRGRRGWRLAAVSGLSAVVLAAGTAAAFAMVTGWPHRGTVADTALTGQRRTTAGGRPGDASPQGSASARAGRASRTAKPSKSRRASGKPPGGRADSPSPTSGTHPPANPSPTSSPPASPGGSGGSGGGGSGGGGGGAPAGKLVPSSGAYLGAYVEPTSYTSDAEVAAVQAFEQQVGRKLDLVHVYHPWDQDFPSPADQTFVDSGKVLLLTWGGDPDTEKIVAGDYDSLITARAKAIAALHRPIMLEFRHEMDRPNLQSVIHGPSNYIAAWDHIRALFTQAGADNVAWVWCPTGYGFQVGRAQAFYPGNSEVDWVCADVYTVLPHQSLAQAAAPFMKFAAGTGKPVIIGEFAQNDPPSSWPGFLTAAGQFVRAHPQIKGIAYFDANGTDSNGHPFTYWLGGHSQAIASFARLVSSPYFQPAIP